jgi:hypothetical protein
LAGEEGLGRDESAFYQAETQMLVRENQMLRLRIRELGEFIFFLSSAFLGGSSWLAWMEANREQRDKSAIPMPTRR